MLAWHDAFGDDPMYVSSDIPRERVDAFASLFTSYPISRE